MTRSTPDGFFDSVSGARPNEVARDALLTGIENAWADPGRLHHPGRLSNQLLGAARESLARALGFSANEIIFVQSVPLAFRIALGCAAHKESFDKSRVMTKWVTSAVEQSFVLNRLSELSDQPVAIVGVDEIARVDPVDFQKSLEPNCIAVLQLANHEVGTKQPWQSVNFDSLKDITWVADATLTSAFEPVPDRVDIAVVSPAAWGGPNGLAIICIRDRVRFSLPIGVGSPIRTTTDLQTAFGQPNVGLVLAAAATLESVRSAMPGISENLANQCSKLRALLVDELADAVLLGAADEKGATPGLVAFSVLYIDAEALLSELASEGISVSSGSSCVADAIGPSHVLAAMGQLTHGNVRVTLPFDTQESDVEHLARGLAAAVTRLRAQAGMHGG